MTPILLVVAFLATVIAVRRRWNDDHRPAKATKKVAAAAVTVLAVLAGTVGVSFANAANPLPTSTGTAVFNANGSVTVNLSGTWNWGNLPVGVTHTPLGDKCDSRFGVGWAVDWSGVSTSSAPAPALSIKNTGKFFHVGTTMDGIYPFHGPCTAAELALDPTGGPSGPWSATHTYANLAAVPQAICANFYDLHGSPGKMNAGDDDPSGNNDNSIKTNSFDPSIGNGFCFNPVFRPNLQIVKSASVSTIGIGGTFNYFLDVTNTGPAPATNAVVTDTIPAGLTVGTPTTTGGGTCGAVGQVVTCNYGSIAAAAALKVTIPVTVAANAPCGPVDNTGHVSAANNPNVDSNTVTVTITCNPGLHIVKSASVSTIGIGGTFNYFLDVTNTGPAPATNAVVTDTIPAGLTVGTPTTTGGGTCGAAGQVVTCNYATIASNGALKVTIPVTVAANAPCGPVDNTGHVSAANNANVDSNTVTVTITCSPGLHIVKSASVSTIGIGGTFNYFLDVTNTGPTAATNAVVTDTVPTGLIVGTPTTTGGGTCTAAGQLVTCNYPSIASNGALKVTIPVIVGVSAPCGPLNNHGTVSAANNPAVDSNTVTVTITCSPGLHIVKSASVSTIDTGGTFNYFLDVSNSGPAPATNAVVTDTVPTGLTVGTPTTTGGGTCTAAGQLVTCNYPSIAVGASPRITIPVFTDSAPCGPYDNHGTVSAANNPAVDSNTVHVVVNCPDITLTVVKTNDANGDGVYNDSETALAAGQTVPFRITVTNNSTVDVVLDSITDAWSTEVGALQINPICAASFVGVDLEPGHSATCDFTVDNYSPPSGSTIINTGEVKGHQETNPDNKGSGTDTSIVDTATPPLTLVVVKTNDADGNGSFTDDETGTAGGSVKFRITITNSSSVDVVIDSISDVWPDANAISPTCAAAVIGAVLPANGGTVTCDFTLDNYVPNSTVARVNTVTVIGHQNHNPGNSTSQQDTSTVHGEQVADVTITRQPTPLARTGSNTIGLVALGLLLIALGLGLLLTSGWRPVAGALAVRMPLSASPEVFTPSRVVIDRDVDFSSRRTRSLWHNASGRARDRFRSR